jgi:hypothetical protein
MADRKTDTRRLTPLEQAIATLAQFPEHPLSPKTAHRYLTYPAHFTVAAVGCALMS